MLQFGSVQLALVQFSEVQLSSKSSTREKVRRQVCSMEKLKEYLSTVSNNNFDETTRHLASIYHPAELSCIHCGL